MNLSLVANSVVLSVEGLEEAMKEIVSVSPGVDSLNNVIGDNFTIAIGDSESFIIT